MRIFDLSWKIYSWRNQKLKDCFDPKLKWINLFFIQVFLAFGFLKRNYFVLIIALIFVFINIFIYGYKLIYFTLVCLILCLIIYLCNKYYQKHLLEHDNLNKNLKVIEIREKEIIVRDLFLNKYSFNNNKEKKLLLYENINANFKVIQSKYQNTKVIPIQINDLRKMSNYDPRYYLFLYLNKSSESYKEFSVPLLFGFNFNSNNIIIQKIRELGVIHLVVISGFHYLIIFKIISFISKRFDKNHYLAMFFLIIYFFIGRKQPSAFKAIMFIVTWNLIKIFKFKKLKLSKFRLLYLIGTLNLIYDPFVALKYGFWITYFLSFYFHSITSVFKKKNKLKVYLETIFISMGINLMMNNSITISTILFSNLLTILFELLITIQLFIFWIIPICTLMNEALFVIINLLHYLNFSFTLNLTHHISFLLMLFMYFVLVTKHLNYQVLNTKKWWIKYN